MAFQLTRLNVPNLTTDYSAETNAAAGLAKTISGLPGEWRKAEEAAQKRQLLGSLTGGGAMDFNKAGLGLLALGDTQGGAALLTLGQKAKEQERESEWMKNNAGILGSIQPSGAPTAALGSPNEVENRFVGTVKQAGLVNPVGLGAVAAYGNAESKYNPGNVNRTWSDPAESGAAGTSGGIMSWREDRLRNLQRFASGKGEQGNGSPETQALFLAQEDPTLIPRLNAAKTPQEANQIMAQAWRFAGHDRPGQGEYARREGLTSQYAQRFAGQPGLPQAPQGVQVAETEEDVQRLEGSAPQMPGSAGVYASAPTPALQAFINNPKVPDNLRGLMQQELARRSGGQPPVQVAQAPAQPGAPVADAPAAGYANAEGGFVIPGTTPGQTASIMGDKQVQNYLRALDGAPERFKGGIQKRLDLRIEELKQARGEEGRSLDAEIKREQLAKARRDNASTAAPTTKVVKQADGSEVAVQWDADSRRWVPLAAPDGGNAVRPAGTKLTEGQSKDLVYHTRGLQALEAFEPVAGAYADGLSRLASQVPGGNYAVSEQFQMARQSGRNLLASILRKDTGAAVTEGEERLYGDIFLPQPGDKPGTLAQKADARKQALDAIRGGLGTAEVLAIGQRLVKRGAGEEAPPRPQPQAPAPVATPSAPQRPAAGSPRTATNPNTGERIMLTPDGQWVPYS